MEHSDRVDAGMEILCRGHGGPAALHTAASRRSAAAGRIRAQMRTAQGAPDRLWTDGRKKYRHGIPLVQRGGPARVVGGWGRDSGEPIREPSRGVAFQG